MVCVREGTKMGACIPDAHLRRRACSCWPAAGAARSASALGGGGGREGGGGGGGEVVEGGAPVEAAKKERKTHGFRTGPAAAIELAFDQTRHSVVEHVLDGGESEEACVHERRHGPGAQSTTGGTNITHLRAFPPLRAFRKAQGLQAPQHLGGGLAGQMLELMRQAIKRFFLRRRSCASRGIQRVHDEAKGALRRVWCTRAATHGNGGAAGGRASGAPTRQRVASTTSVGTLTLLISSQRHDAGEGEGRGGGCARLAPQAGPRRLGVGRAGPFPRRPLSPPHH